VDIVNTWTKIPWQPHQSNSVGSAGVLRDDLLQDQTFSPAACIASKYEPDLDSGAATGFGNAFASFLLDSPSQVGRDVNTYFPAYRNGSSFHSPAISGR